MNKDNCVVVGVDIAVEDRTKVMHIPEDPGTENICIGCE